MKFKFLALSTALIQSALFSSAINWQAPEGLISGNITFEGGSLQYSDEGTAMIAWIERSSDEESETTPTTIKVQFSSGSSWGDPITVVENMYDFDTLSSATNNASDFVLAWTAASSTDSQRKLYTSIYQNGSWSTPEAHTDGTTEALDVVVDMNASSNIAVAWTDNAEEANHIYTKIYMDGSWGENTQISQNVFTNNDEPRIQINSSDNVLASYRTDISDGEEQGVAFAILYSSGTWADAPTRVSSLSENVNQSDLSYNNSGNAVLVWEEATEGIIRASYLSSGSWSTPTSISQGIGLATEPYVGLTNSGVAYAAWSEEIGGETLPRAATFDGTSWGTPETISPEGSEGTNVTINVSTADHAVITYIETIDDTSLVRAASRENGGWSEIPPAFGDTNLTSLYGICAINNQGNTLGAYLYPDGSKIFLAVALGPKQTMTSNQKVVRFAMQSEVANFVSWNELGTQVSSITLFKDGELLTNLTRAQEGYTEQLQTLGTTPTFVLSGYDDNGYLRSRATATTQ